VGKRAVPHAPTKEDQKGDLLFSRANTRELVGATAIIEQDYPELLLPDKLWKVLFTNEMDVYYAKHILSTQAIRKVFSSQSTGTSGSMFNVSAEKFRETSIPVPPIMLQREFASFVQQTNKSKLVIQNGLERLELMKKALMQKYFGGK
jgi:type I restriction enzyme S subunit